MPPRAKKRDYTALDALGIATGEYVYLVTKHTERARHLPNLTQIHEQGSQQWLRIAPAMPAPGDPAYAAKRDAFFAACDRYCKCATPEDPVQSVVAVQAAGFAMQTSMAEIEALPDADQSYVYKKAKDYSSEKCRQREAELGIPYCPIPPPTVAASTASFPMIPYPPGTVVQYRTVAGDTAYCTIVDYGTSRVRGDYFIIRHRDGGGEEHLTKKQMFDLLDRSMDICEPEK
ncbi:hypothetical protein PLEOSDRAFT_1098190 [Pleurotus ostreatus PC15]|uniref:Uncharacterized protein n=1 Tax=Pleurotus ostreatus (strain PC15) TaxID=1137138 RepID=A0A067N8V2_PLEO1|nr:hypothetical protein PLEOSDRAFT_1098190 [Pleurotus ostreatus PC15]